MHVGIVWHRGSAANRPVFTELGPKIAPSPPIFAGLATPLPHVFTVERFRPIMLRLRISSYCLIATFDVSVVESLRNRTDTIEEFNVLNECITESHRLRRT